MSDVVLSEALVTSAACSDAFPMGAAPAVSGGWLYPDFQTRPACQAQCHEAGATWASHSSRAWSCRHAPCSRTCWGANKGLSQAQCCPIWKGMQENESLSQHGLWFRGLHQGAPISMSVLLMCVLHGAVLPCSPDACEPAPALSPLPPAVRAVCDARRWDPADPAPHLLATVLP